MSNFMKILLIGAELFHEERPTNGQTDGRRESDITKPILILFMFVTLGVNYNYYGINYRQTQITYNNINNQLDATVTVY